MELCRQKHQIIASPVPQSDGCRRPNGDVLKPTGTLSLTYITLAKESPIRIQESDEDFYNSFNEQETDTCQDSSDTSDTDTESQSSRISRDTTDDKHIDTIALMEVVEYEVASATESENDSLDGSSSGTERDFFIAAVAQAAADNSSASEFAILADTEESDDQSRDMEFTPADYWQCVKCKNKQNNPMYRYCEKCYQVRKSLFPPRPKQKRKIRSEEVVKHEELSDCSDSSSSSSSSSSTILKGLGPKHDSRLDTRVKRFRSRKPSLSKVDGVASPVNSSREHREDVTIRSEKEVDTVMSKPPGAPVTSSSSVGLIEQRNLKRGLLDSIHEVNGRPAKKRINEKGEPNFAEITVTKGFNLDILKDSGFSSSSSSQERIEEENFEISEKYPQTAFGKQAKAIEGNGANKPHPDASKTGNDDCQTVSRVSSFSADSDFSCYKEDAAIVQKHSSDFSQDTPESENNLGVCMFCLSEPKNSVFVHSNFVHLCCCYKCAIKVWKQRKSCPICNCKVKNVMKLFIH